MPIAIPSLLHPLGYQKPHRLNACLIFRLNLNALTMPRPQSVANHSKDRQTHFMTNAIPPRFDISRPEIEQVVKAFYKACRAHPGLAPVFSAHVEDWDGHEAKVSDFWAGTLLHESQYSGNVLRSHVQAGNVKPGMFSTWLTLFDATLEAELRPEQAAAWSALAHRIGYTLRAGVVERDTLPGGVPNLGHTGFSSQGQS